MTFTEAALEVLRGAGEPLHYKKITELAIAGNLLSHVGKSPEVTMSSRLATLVKKDRGQSPIVKVRPGVFALRESGMETDKEPTETTTHDLAALDTNGAPEGEAAEQPKLTERPKLPGADVFPEEADDDAPILAGLDEGPEGEERGGRRRRRRRRRGGKGGGLDGMPTEPLADRPPQSSREQQPPPRREARENNRFERDRGAPDRDRARFEHDRRPEFGRDRDRDRGQDRDRDRDRGQDRGQDRNREAQPELDWNRQPADGDLLGKDLADAAYHVLTRGDRTPASFARVADMLVRRGRLSGTPEALAPTVAAALRADAARAARADGRPRFRISGQRVSLSEWLLPREAVRSEESVEQSAEQQRDHVRRAFVGRLNDLPAAGFAEVIATWLNGEGLTALRAVRRPGSSGREFHFAGTLRRGAEENRLALLVVRGGRDIDRDAVVEMRGSMHHYGGASGAWLITTGRVQPAAREEAGAEGAAPVALLGGSDLARAMEKLGIGLRQHFVALCDIDFDLLEALGDGTEVRREGRGDGREVRGEGREGREGRDREGRDRDNRDARGRRDDRQREQRDGREGRERGGESESGRARESRETEPPQRTFDLLDPEAAEASRLVPEAATWTGDEPDEDEDTDTAEMNRPTTRFVPGAQGDETESANALEAAEDADLDDEAASNGDDDDDDEVAAAGFDEDADDEDADEALGDDENNDDEDAADEDGEEES
jgi:hypothetical protein